ncbi:MAG: LysR family transcriptional regulator [Pseudomonadota bacterium]
MTRPNHSLSVRIDLPNGMRFGPGKAALLRQLQQTGSIRAAATDLQMSYPRALKLIEQMNHTFARPLVETTHGGAGGGGARVTQSGLSVLELYDEICDAAMDAGESKLKRLITFLAI